MLDYISCAMELYARFIGDGGSVGTSIFENNRIE